MSQNNWLPFLCILLSCVLTFYETKRNGEILLDSEEEVSDRFSSDMIRWIYNNDKRPLVAEIMYELLAVALDRNIG